MNISHNDSANTLDISGYNILYSSEVMIIVVQLWRVLSIKDPDSNDITISNLTYANTIYDMSINLFNVDDLSNTNRCKWCYKTKWFC